MVDNSQYKLKRIRPPRVKITYDVETEDSNKKVEIPFIIGVISNLSGHNNDTNTINKIKFSEIDRSNFNNYIRSINPKLSYAIDKIDSEGKIKVDLQFKSMNDFEILEVIKQITETKELYEQIQKLKEMMVKIDGNDTLAAMMTKILIDKKAREKLQNEIKNIDVKNI